MDQFQRRKEPGDPIILINAKLAEVKNMMMHSFSKSFRKLSMHYQISYDGESDEEVKISSTLYS